MLNLDHVKTELEKYQYSYHQNILVGHTKSKIKWVLPTGIGNILAFEQATSYLFGFREEGIDLFPVTGDWKIASHLLISWEDVISFQMKQGLLENEMRIQTNSMNIVMKINKIVANNPWVKENINYLKENNYFYKGA